HPMPRVAFGPPLQLGIRSRCEFADLYLNESMEPELIQAFLDSALPPTLSVHSVEVLPVRGDSIQSQIVAHRFTATWLVRPQGVVAEALDGADLVERISQLTVERQVKVRKRRKRRREAPQVKTLSLGDSVSDVERIAPTPERPFGGLSFILHTPAGSASVRPYEVIAAVSGCGVSECDLVKEESFFQVEEDLSQNPCTTEPSYA
ncbi:MAG: DUF2344 domain-containing protein, partial [Bdellovibrionales bacterium]|nr:DUF2344 domain-containing protein [Bdellovibrionales bacterium]